MADRKTRYPTDPAGVIPPWPPAYEITAEESLLPYGMVSGSSASAPRAVLPNLAGMFPGRRTCGAYPSFEVLTSIPGLKVRPCRRVLSKVKGEHRVSEGHVARYAGSHQSPWKRHAVRCVPHHTGKDNMTVPLNDQHSATVLTDSMWQFHGNERTLAYSLHFQSNGSLTG